jgi:putative endonuclease
VVSQGSPKALAEVRFLPPLLQACKPLVACHNMRWYATRMYYVYILQSQKDYGLYIGYTNNLKERIKEHQDGKSFATKGRCPVKLIHYQGFISQKDALETEKYLKITRGWERIHRMLKDTLKLK